MLTALCGQEHFHEKEYLVTVDREVTAQFIRQMSEGVPILDTVTRKCMVEKTGKYSFRIVRPQGFKQIDQKNVRLFRLQSPNTKRVRIMNLTLDGLKPGEFREIRPEEWQELTQMLKNSSNETIIGGHYGNNPAADEKELVKKLNKAAKAYYQEDRDIMDNREYDDLYDQLIKDGAGNRNRSCRQPHSKRRV